MKNKFVFVVCGAKEHIETLHFSLKYLSKYSSNEIIVLTDISRNEIRIKHNNVIDIKTSKEFNHHQASIYLKTGIHKFLPKGNNYCYLDTDVVALNKEVDLIFEEFKAPIIFAKDHCNVHQFSRNAIKCQCEKKFNEDAQGFNDFFKKNKAKVDFNLEVSENKTMLEKKFLAIEGNVLLKNYLKLKFHLPFNKIWISSDFYFDKKLQSWHDKKGNTILYEIGMSTIAKQNKIYYSKELNKWVNQHNKDIWDFGCNHLVKAIKSDFKINVKSQYWQHWNGGVFLFNDESHEFLEAWHNKTMQIFNLPNWQTRDQGTLIATAWEFGLVNHSTLNPKWNFLADYKNDEIDFNEKGFFTTDKWKTQEKANFVHIYHHWADKNWPLWNWVENKINE